MLNLKKLIAIEILRTRKWANDNILGLFLFNLILMFLILLHSAGYFAPFFPLTINVIVFICTLSAIFLLRATSRSLFSVALFFWIFAGLLKLLGINIWAERTVIYAYELLVVGFLLMIVEYRRNSK